jgi:DNA-binding SARP family transcriptional activator
VIAARLRLLEGFQLGTAGQSLELPVSGQRLLAFMALAPRAQQRSYIARRLWPDTTEERAAANLRSTLWRVRRHHFPLVASIGTRLSLGAVRTDVNEAIRTLEEAMAGEVSTVRLGQLPLTAELLPAWDEEWVLAARKRYRQFRLHALERICHRLMVQQRYGNAIEVALAVVAMEPLRTSARRLLIQTYLAEGNRGEAVREYDGYSDLLHQRLGQEPPRDLVSLVRQG